MENNNAEQVELTEEELLAQLDEQHRIRIEKLNDLKSFFVLHLTGKYDLNLCYGVIFAIFSLEKDIKQNMIQVGHTCLLLVGSIGESASGDGGNGYPISFA